MKTSTIKKLLKLNLTDNDLKEIALLGEAIFNDNTIIEWEKIKSKYENS